MLVTEVKKITDRRNRICLEDGTSFVLYAAETRKLRIREQEDLPEEALRRIMEEILKKRACLRCMNLLMSRDRTVQQLRHRLMMDGYPEEIITGVKKGVDRDTVRTAFLEEEDPNREEEAVLALARRRGYDPDTADEKESARFYRYLMGKGFGYEVIRRALAQDLD